MRLFSGAGRWAVVAFLSGSSYFYAAAQDCPSNIDFESGTFDGWTCYTGTAGHNGSQNLLSIFPSGGPVPGRHTIFPAFPSAGLDPYGGFPINCPNGSGYSVRLGNDQAGTQAEGISYEFTIPANQDIYSLIYHYAVVFQDPNHEIYEQPRMEIEILNVTDNKIIFCSSFTFIPFGTILPGFFESPNPGSNTPVWCKDWTAVSINLNNHAGKTIRLFFKTGDCTFRRHFGYAYIDVNTECNSEFVGAAYCPDDTIVNITAPYGYQSYTWFDRNFSQEIGRNQTISFKPVPAPGTTYAVEVIPYFGYGCTDTLYARMADDLKVTSNAGKDVLSCNGEPVQIGVNSIPGLSYSWSPPAGLSNTHIANPVSAPQATTPYILTTRSNGGGCADTDTIVVTASIIDNSIELSGKANYCIDSGDSAVLRVKPTQTIQWHRDNTAISGAIQPYYQATQSGSYHATLVNSDGCESTTEVQPIIIDEPRPGINYPIEYAVLDLPLELETRQFGVTATWAPSTWLDNPDSYTPIFDGMTDQLYTIEITTAGGCVTVDTQLVKTVKQVEVHVPTAFTPNNDGLNDFLRPILFGIKEVRYFKIFNRWGQLIFETKNERPGWNGTLNGIKVPAQVVVWIMEGIGVDNKTHIRKGTSTLIR
jgi:gliding motility-associated-like protein